MHYRIVFDRWKTPLLQVALFIIFFNSIYFLTDMIPLTILDSFISYEIFLAGIFVYLICWKNYTRKIKIISKKNIIQIACLILLFTGITIILNSSFDILQQLYNENREPVLELVDTYLRISISDCKQLGIGLMNMLLQMWIVISIYTGTFKKSFIETIYIIVLSIWGVFMLTFSNLSIHYIQYALLVVVVFWYLPNFKTNYDFNEKCSYDIEKDLLQYGLVGLFCYYVKMGYDDMFYMIKKGIEMDFLLALTIFTFLIVWYNCKKGLKLFSVQHSKKTLRDILKVLGIFIVSLSSISFVNLILGSLHLQRYEELAYAVVTIAAYIFIFYFIILGKLKKKEISIKWFFILSYMLYGIIYTLYDGVVPLFVVGVTYIIYALLDKYDLIEYESE